MSTQAVEDYVKAVYLLKERGIDVTTNNIAEHLSVKAGSVTGMLRKLAGLNLIEYEPYRSIELTDGGRKIALEVIRHHRLIELFLAEALGMPWDEVHDEAERLEHVISEKLEDRIAEALGNPEFDPHGDPIPARDGTITKRRLTSLSELEIGDSAIIARVRNQDPEVLRYLGDAGLRPGSAVACLRREPLNGPVIVQVNDAERVLAREVAMQIMVEA